MVVEIAHSSILLHLESVSYVCGADDDLIIDLVAMPAAMTTTSFDVLNASTRCPFLLRLCYYKYDDGRNSYVEYIKHYQETR